MPKKTQEVGTDETGWPDDQGPNPVILEAAGNGTLLEVYEWDAAVQAQQLAALPEPDPVCDRLACFNPPAVTCPNCGANYCEIHPPANEPENTCDRCEFDLGPDNPFADAFEREMARMAAVAKERERAAEAKKARRAELRRARKEELARQKTEEREALKKRMAAAALAEAEKSEEEISERKKAREQRLQEVKDKQAALLAEIEAEKEAQQSHFTDQQVLELEAE